MSFILVKDYEKHHILIRADMIWVIFVLPKRIWGLYSTVRDLWFLAYGYWLDGAKARRIFRLAKARSILLRCARLSCRQGSKLLSIEPAPKTISVGMSCNRHEAISFIIGFGNMFAIFSFCFSQEHYHRSL